MVIDFGSGPLIPRDDEPPNFILFLVIIINFIQICSYFNIVRYPQSLI